MASLKLLIHVRCRFMEVRVSLETPCDKVSLPAGTHNFHGNSRVTTGAGGTPDSAYRWLPDLPHAIKVPSAAFDPSVVSQPQVRTIPNAYRCTLKFRQDPVWWCCMICHAGACRACLECIRLPCMRLFWVEGNTSVHRGAEGSRCKDNSECAHLLSRCE